MDKINSTNMFIGLSSREAFGKVITQLGEQNKEVVALTADLTNSVKLNEFKTRFPTRFFNFGVAEQNMMGAAAGFTLAGKIPFACTYAAFSSMRACEQVRTDIAYNDLPVKIVSSHGGFSFGIAGATHHAIEDVGIFRGIPGMTVLVPADAIETTAIMRAIVNISGPVYVRLSRVKEKTVYSQDFEYKIGSPDLLQEGNDIVLIAMGAQVGETLEAARLLLDNGISAGVMNISTIKPMDGATVVSILNKYTMAMTVEEHSIINGLGSAISELIAAYHVDIKFKRHGLQDVFTTSGLYPDLLKYYHLDAQGIRETVIKFIEKAQ